MNTVSNEVHLDIGRDADFSARSLVICTELWFFHVYKGTYGEGSC